MAARKLAILFKTFSGPTQEVEVYRPKLDNLVFKGDVFPFVVSRR